MGLFAGAIFVISITLLIALAAPRENSPAGNAPPSTENTGSLPPAQRLIVLDPGHGGHDPGCVYGGYFEKDLNLSLALKVRDALKEQGFLVLLTREDDSAVSPEDRAAIPQNAGADIFISIHHNSLEDDTVTEGIETWYNDGMNRLNASFAGYIQNEVSSATGGKNRKLKISDRLIVLQGASMPSCLLEAGFLSSDKERMLLVTGNYQDKLARGIADGIVRFFNEAV
jgi:N-acetylmuramoyl-L-alanine amidase